MKRILVIAPSSYPIIIAEAIVNAKLLKALSKSGKFEIDLISQKHKYSHYPSESIDIDLKSHHIVETSLKADFESIYLHALALPYFGITFKGIHWAVKALPIVRKLVQVNKYDYVLTKDGSSFVLGYYLKKHYGVKWIATCNDPFPDVKYPAPYGKGYDADCNYHEKYSIKAVSAADMIVFPSERLRNYMLQYLNTTIDKTIIIPHVILNKDNNRKDINYNNKLRIIHTGNLKNPRNPDTFLKAFKQLREAYGSLNMEVTFMGLFSNDLDKKIKGMELGEYIKLLPPMKYSESIKALSDYDLALIIEAPCKDGIFLPTKVTDFIQEGIRILSISPKIGTLNDMYNKNVIEYFADVNNVADIYNTLNNVYTDYQKKQLKKVDNSNLKDFSEETIINQHINL